MIPAVIPGATVRDVGKTQGYKGLTVKYSRGDEGEIKTSETSWEPTPAEIRRLIRGANVHLLVAGRQPPVVMSVGDASDSSEEDSLVEQALTPLLFFLRGAEKEGVHFNDRSATEAFEAACTLACLNPDRVRTSLNI